LVLIEMINLSEDFIPCPDVWSLSF